MIPVRSLIGFLINKLSEPEAKRIQGLVSALILENNELVPKANFGFMFMGTKYVSAATASPLPELHTSLVELGSAMSADAKQLKLDMDLISQSLFVLLKQCTSNQLYRDSLPECLVSLVPEFSNMPRQFDQFFLISHDRRAIRQYKTIEPKIEMYAMMKYIF